MTVSNHHVFQEKTVGADEPAHSSSQAEPEPVISFTTYPCHITQT